MREIVGVVADVKRASLTEKALPEYYIPIEQAPVAPPPVAMRVEGDPAQYQSAVQAAVASLDGALPVYRMHPVSDDLIRTTAQQRFQTILVGSFALIALLLAAVGLYALLSYMVTQRKMELGLRIALGAQRQDVLGLILTRGLGLAGIGLALGVSASFFATRLLASMLFQVDPHDGLALAGASLVLITVALMASLFPALRASQLDPVETLRSQ
jgi:ABC-type antimicrobial peptide transport system permease subunit